MRSDERVKIAYERPVYPQNEKQRNINYEGHIHP